MKFGVSLTVLGLVLILSLPILSLVARIAEIQAVQQAQMMGYHVLEVSEKTIFGTWFRRKCSFPQTTYVKLRGTPDHIHIYTIDFCINEWTGNITSLIYNN